MLFRSEQRSELLSIDEARGRRFDGGWSDYTPPPPQAPGIHLIDDVSVAELRAYIDWTPFLKTWELHGAYPAILDDEVVGAQARSLLADAAKLLEEMAIGDVLEPRAIIGLFPACSDGDDVHLFDASGPDGAPIATIRTLRQQFGKDGRAKIGRAHV